VAEKTVQGALMSKSEGTFDSSGRVYGQLKRGETVTLLDGRQFNGAELCGPIEGRKIAYCTDTVYCDGGVLPRMQMC